MPSKKLSRRPSLPLHILSSLLVVLLLTACKEKSEAPAEEIIASPGATEVPTPLPTLPASLVSVGSLSDLKSFRYSIEIKLKMPEPEDELLQGLASLLSNVEIRGASVPPDNSEMRMTLKESGHSIGTITVGGHTWFSSGEEWTETLPSALAASLLTPERISGAIARGQMFAGITPLREHLEGTRTLHYTATEQGMRVLSLLLSMEEEAGVEGETRLDLWLTEEGHYPVKIGVNASSIDEEGRDTLVTLEMRVTDLNDPSIEIKPPQT